MKAFVEHLSGIVRVGSSADKYGDPWEQCATFASVDGKVAHLKAYRGNGALDRAHVRAAIAVLKEVCGFLEVTWDSETRHHNRGDK